MLTAIGIFLCVLGAWFAGVIYGLDGKMNARVAACYFTGLSFIAIGTILVFEVLQ